MTLYLVVSREGWVEAPITHDDLRKSDTIIAEFHNDIFYTAEENFNRFAEWVSEQGEQIIFQYTGKQLKELHKMWLEQQ